MKTKFAFLCLLAVGCGSSNNNDQACTDVSTKLCARLAQCSMFDLGRRYGTMDACLTRQKQQCLTVLSSSGTSQTSTTEEACSAAYATYDCNALIQGVAPPACQATAGARANGQPCSFNSQCMSTFCATAPGAMCGTCANVPNVGDSCAMLTSCGGRGLECDPVTTTCVQPGTANAACNRTDQPCGTGLACVGTTRANPTGTCQPQGTAAGAACDPTRKTAADCDRDALLYCASNNMCAAIVQVAAGQPCGLIGGVETLCQAGAACYGASGTTAGTCKALAADGMQCDSINGPGCIAPARCVGMEEADGGATGTCQVQGGTC